MDGCGCMEPDRGCKWLMAESGWIMAVSVDVGGWWL